MPKKIDAVKDANRRIEEIAAALAAGARHEDFEQELDELLGTGLEARDREAEASWEDGYREREEP